MTLRNMSFSELGTACPRFDRDILSFITSSTSCSRSRRIRPESTAHTDPGAIDESIDLSRDR